MDGGKVVKQSICTAAAVAAGTISYLVGGWNMPLWVLMVCMGVDYLTGLIVAGVFHASPKSSGGGLDSAAGWKGLSRKFVTLLIVVMANLMDLLLELHYIRDAVIVGFCANEMLSVLENAGLMGLPIPQVLTEAIDQLRRKEDANG